MNYIEMIDNIILNKEIFLKDTTYEIITDKKRYTKLSMGFKTEWIMQEKEVQEEPAVKIRVVDLMPDGLAKTSGRGEEFLRLPAAKISTEMDEPTTIKVPEKIIK